MNISGDSLRQSLKYWDQREQEELHTENSNPEADLCEVACGGKRSSQTGALNQSHLCQRPLPVQQPVGDEVDEPVSVSEVGTQRMAQVVVGTDISKHRHQTCKHSNTLVTLSILDEAQAGLKNMNYPEVLRI